MYKIFFSILLGWSFTNLLAQFDPQMGMGGTKGIAKDSAIIKNWANSVYFELGFKNISDTTSGFTTIGDRESPLGAADGKVLSLGDGGVATLSFKKFIYNGIGPDFVVFENGFIDADSKESFLELAFVEVSSDGKNFFRFRATSNTDTLHQINSFGTIDASKINNLAGKYVNPFGTPFDLEELKTVVGLDINKVGFVRIIDVVGSLQPKYASVDSRGWKVNDPFPTEFPSGGFDLDAVGVINESVTNSVDNSLHNNPLSIFPNPIQANQILTLVGNIDKKSVFKLSDVYGNNIEVNPMMVENATQILLPNLSAGLYFLQILTDKIFSSHKIEVY
jgi:hypothetical protein